MHRINTQRFLNDDGVQGISDQPQSIDVASEARSQCGRNLTGHVASSLQIDRVPCTPRQKPAEGRV
ncbi:MAG: hypothetical protein ACXW2Q_11390, partial [Thermoanaerobaculia bacterium]